MPRLSYLVVILGLLAAFRAPAATFVVNSSNDVDDGACTTNHCSLREAIRASNSLFGADTILFNISPGGVQVITPLSALPPLTDAVNLDATSQPGYSGMPIIGLRGGAAGAANGLQVQAGSCTVKGLAIFSFALDGMVITGAGSSTIAGNFLGTDTGGAGMGNAGNGLQISNSPGNRIEDNILSDNGASGVLLTGGGAVGNAVVGNKIGTTASGGPLG
ncbi:MAG TPA: CSLREA domain-containing protein, partial [Myxococcales bacterium]|nr:CSLREA domain-containing protein [Myxococcales bacterium]